jgi:lysozyme family protein
MTDIAALTAANAKRWKAMHINDDRRNEIDVVARRLISGKSRYQEISAATGVPWSVVAVIHEREASGSWGANIAQGDPWNRVSTHVPAGRGPFISFKAAAIDALTKCPPYAGAWRDWSPGGAMTLLEQYNGLAYASHGVPSPYVWSGTDQYTTGKVLVDHGPIMPVADKQLGCAALIYRMAQIDSSAGFDGASAKPPALPLPHPAKPGGAVAGAAGGAAAAHQAGLGIGWVIVIAIGCAVLGWLIGHFAITIQVPK